jgi:hypothetical protein
VTGTVPTSNTRIRDTLTVVQPVRCQGGSSGAISLVIIGGTPPYHYQWSHGAQTRDVSNLPAGDYSLTVTDQLGCQAVFSGFEVREPAEALSLAVEAMPASCHALADGSVSASVAGGNAPYSFEWFFQGQIIAVAANTSQLDGLAAGPYSLTLRDSNNCVLQSSFAIAEPDPLLVGIELSPPVPPDPGMAEAVVSGGSPGYDYLWNTGETSPAIEVQAGAYALTVTDQNGCPAEASVMVVQTFELSVVEQARLYPNPARQRLWLEVQLAEAVELQWSVVSALGQPWQQGRLPAAAQQRLEIELAGLPPGVYWLLLSRQGQVVYRGRFVKG